MAKLWTCTPHAVRQVGDTIRVHFRNNARFPFTISPLGLPVGKKSEGADYADGLSDNSQAQCTRAHRSTHIRVAATGTPELNRLDNHVDAVGINTFTCGGLDFWTGCSTFVVKTGNSLMLDWTITEDAAPSEKDGDSVL